jgi:hypothetical protein
MNSNKTTNVIHFSGMTPYYVINQSMITICDMKKMLGGEAKQNLLDSAYSLCYLFDIYQQKLNIVINFTFLPF